MPKLIIYTDGGSRRNPGPSAAGVVIIDGDTKHEFKKFLGEKQTNNWAEYEAVVFALQQVKELGHSGRDIEFRLDSKLVAEQLTGNWKIKEPTLRPQAQKVHALLKDFGSVVFTYIPREQNSDADRLVNEVLDERV